MALQKRFNDPRKQFVDPYWTIISGVLSHGRGRSKLTWIGPECVELKGAQASISQKPISLCRGEAAWVERLASETGD
jgi:hypothetical protein